MLFLWFLFWLFSGLPAFGLGDPWFIGLVVCFLIDAT